MNIKIFTQPDYFFQPPFSKVLTLAFSENKIIASEIASAVFETPLAIEGLKTDAARTLKVKTPKSIKIEETIINTLRTSYTPFLLLIIF